MVSFDSFIERLKISGGKRHRFAEAVDIDKSKVVDMSEPLKNNISTSVDAYVSGHYTDRNGNVLEVKQRYTIFVSYSKDSLFQAIPAIKKRMLDDFQQKYPGMNIDDTFVPNLIAPLGQQGMIEDEAFYFGSKLFKELTRVQSRGLALGSAADMYKRNIDTIKKRYTL